MLPSPEIPDEESRLKAVAEYDPHGVFDPGALDTILELARDLFGVPTAFVSIVGRDEQVFVARQGLALCSTPRDISFCGHALAQAEVLVVLDASVDLRFHDNPLVLGPPRIRFYAGMPLVGPLGHAVGTLCLADGKPRASFGAAEQRHLRHLADMVLQLLEQRRLSLAGRVGQARFENIAATSPDSIICTDWRGRITFWNQAAERLFGHHADAAVGRGLDLIVPPQPVDGHDAALQQVARGEMSRLVGKVVELVAQKADGTEVPIELSLSMWQEAEGACFGAILRDVTERRAKEEQLFRLAHHDPLTDLPNRKELRRRLEQVAETGGRATLLLVDLDRFKTVNDDLGHAEGDVVLREVGRRLLACVRVTDTVARLGGDEFAVLLGGVNEVAKAGDVAAAVIRTLSHPFCVEGGVVTTGASVGIAVHGPDGVTADELLRSADLALYEAKDDGRQCFRVYSPLLRRATDRARAYDTELHRAVAEGEFEVFYQPQVRLENGGLTGAEALLRWRHPRDGLLLPAAFLPGLENRPISAEVGSWVLRTACVEAARWRRLGCPEFRVGVNLFASQLRAGDLVEQVLGALELARLPAEALELEVTENITIRHEERMVEPLRQLRSGGVGVAFDDYGTGYASLSMLKRFPLTRLKIDKSFVQAMCGSSEDAAVIRAVLHLGRAFGISVIAEGVETEEQVERLRRKGCQEAQGYLFGHPMPAAMFARTFGLCEAALEASPGN